MGIKKVIKLVIKIVTWFYQKWIRKIKFKSDKDRIKMDLKQIQHSASVFGKKPNIFQPSAF